VTKRVRDYDLEQESVNRRRKRENYYKFFTIPGQPNINLRPPLNKPFASDY